MIIRDPVLGRFFFIVILVLLVWLLYLLKPVLVPFIVAFFLAYLINPLINYLGRIGMPRWLGILTILLVLGVALAVVLSLLVPQALQQLQYARANLPEFVDWLNTTLLPWFEQRFGINVPFVETTAITNSILEYVQENYSTTQAKSMIAQIASSGMSVVNVLGLVVLVPVVAFYMLLDWNNMLSRIKLVIPRPLEARILTLVKESNDVLGAFIRGQLLVMIILGVIYGVGLQLIGLELGLMIGVVAGLASIIPYLGFAVGIIVATVACLFQFGFEWFHLLLVLGVFMFGQLIEGYVLQPYLLGDRIGLSPVMVIFSVLAGASLMGFLGMLIALPVAAVLMVMARHLFQAYYDSSIYHGPAKLSLKAKQSTEPVADNDYGDLLFSEHNQVSSIDDKQKSVMAWVTVADQALANSQTDFSSSKTKRSTDNEPAKNKSKNDD